MESATFNVNMHSPLMLSTSSSTSPSPTALLALWSSPSMRRRLLFSMGTARSGDDYLLMHEDQANYHFTAMAACLFLQCVWFKKISNVSNIILSIDIYSFDTSHVSCMCSVPACDTFHLGIMSSLVLHVVFEWNVWLFCQDPNFDKHLCSSFWAQFRPHRQSAMTKWI